MAGLRGIRSVCAFLILISAPWLLAGVNGWSGNGPNGGTIVSLACHPERPGVVFAATAEEGVFKSTNGGRSWFSATIPVFEEDILITLFIDPFEPDHIYVHTGYSGLFHSTDGGQEWEWLSYGPYDWTEYMTAHPYRQGTLFGSVAYGLYRSTDGGESWEGISSVQTVICMAFDPRDPEVLWAGTWDNGLLRSTNGGLDWADAGPGLPSSVTALACLPGEPDTLYAAAGWGIYKTTDQGQTWGLSRPQVGPVETWQIEPDPASPGSVYATTLGAGIYRTDDGGGTWQAVNEGLGDWNLNRMLLDPSESGTVLAGALGSGVYRTEDHGAHWSPSNRGLTASYTLAVAFDPFDPALMYAGTWSGGVYRSMDGGGNWWTFPSRASGATVRTVAVDPLQPGLMYAGTSGRGVLVSTDSGVSWASTAASIENRYVRCLAIDPQSPSTLYAGCADLGSQVGGIFKTTNGGASWDRLLTSGTVYFLEIDPQSPSTVWTFEYESGLAKSTDGGMHWYPADMGTDYPLVLTMAFNPQNGQEVYAGVENRGIYKTVDGGSSWELVDDALTEFGDIVVDPLDPRWVCAGGMGGIRLSRDGGTTWISVDTGLPSTPVISLAADPLNNAHFIAGVDSHGVFEMLITADLDQDAEVGPGDVEVLRAVLVDNISAPLAGPTASDIDLDSKTTIRDLMVLQRMVAGGEQERENASPR